MKVTEMPPVHSAKLVAYNSNTAHGSESIQSQNVVCSMPMHIALKLPWICPGPPLTFNGALGNMQGDLTSRGYPAKRALPAMLMHGR